MLRTVALYTRLHRAWEPLAGAARDPPPPWATKDCGPFHGPDRVHTVTAQHSEFFLIHNTRAIGRRQMTGDHLIGDTWAHKLSFSLKVIAGQETKKKEDASRYDAAFTAPTRTESIWH